MKYLLSIYLFLSFPVFAQEIKIAGGEIEELVTLGDSGLYNKILNKMAIRDRLTVMPARRAVDSFERKGHDCVIPGNLANTKLKTIDSLPLNWAKVYIITRREDPILTDLSKRGQIGIVSGIT